MTQTKRTVTPALTRLLLHATFRSETVDFASAAPACSRLVENGLVSSWKDVTHSDNKSKLPETWLRTMMHDPIGRDLQALKSEEDDNERLCKQLHDGMGGPHEVLAKVSDTEEGWVFRPVAQDMLTMKIVLSALTPDDIDVDVLAPARDRLNESRMEDLKKGLEATDVGNQLLVNVAKVM